MGTRNLTCVVLGGEYKIAQYGQWDGDPGGQGATILDFLCTPGNTEKLKGALGKVRFLEPEGKDKKFMVEYYKNAPEWSSEPDNRTPEQKYWFQKYISRDIGGEILEAVSSTDDREIVLRNSINFAGDSLFCEWAYVVDLDKGTFEVYKGFNEGKVGEGRFKSDDEVLKNDNNYEPVILANSFPLSELPTNDVFCSSFYEEDEED